MSRSLQSIRRGALAWCARARGALPPRVNDAVFALPCEATDDTPALARRMGWTCVDLGANLARHPRALFAASAAGAVGGPNEAGLRVGDLQAADLGSEDLVAVRHLAAALPTASSAPHAFAAVIPRGRVLGLACSAVAPGGHALADVSPHAGEPLARHRALTSFVIAPRPRRVAGRSALLGAIGHDNFYHWMFDVLPRIGLVRDASLAPIDHWIVAETRLKVARELLVRCGIDPARLVAVGKGGHVECEELVVTSAPGAICQPTPRAAAFLRASLGIDAAPHGQAPAAGRRIYVARRGRRKVANEADLAPVLEHSGLEVVAMEGLGLDAQIAAFRGASLIVAPHGAALAHLVHAAPGATLIELIPRGYLNQSFYALAGACGMRYHALVGEPAPSSPGGPTERDFTIDAQRLDRTIRAVEPCA